MLVCFWGQSQLWKSLKALNYWQWETLAKMIGHLQLPPIISTGFLYMMDATGRPHTVTMDMAHSLEVH